MDLLNKALGTVFFSGYAPLAPGTAGSAVAALLYYCFAAPLEAAGWVAVLALVFAVAVYTAGALAGEWGDDPGRVVIDEAVGFLVTVAFLPHSFWMAVGGFFIFRVLDILKPPPARQLEALPGGWGIVLDDVAAGIYGNLLIRLGLAIYQGGFAHG
ncbi:MAG: phosphatidylglycerophosphatase A [Candidatus Latescibacteria bacterium]|nr:phosphatidylglycerophosphatase A [Candidatus Latescibacterota bacterium]